MTPAPPATATTSSSYKFPSADTPLATKVVVDLVVKETHSAHSAHYMPNYIDMCKRRLDGCGISVGDCILWNVGGRPVKAVIKDVEGSASQYFRVNRNTTEIQAKMVQQETENTLIMKMSEEAEGLVSMIDYSFQHSEEFQLLGIPAVKSILLHGVAGVGKTTVVRYASQFLRCSLFDISVHELLELSEEFENTQFVSYNPLRLVMKQAIISAPSIVVLRDLNDLVNGSEHTAKLLTIIASEIQAISVATPVCLIGIAKELKTLPEALKKTDIFHQHLTIPIPSMPQRKSILENILKDIPLKEPLNGKNPIEYYSVQISMRTSGYVARDLRLLCRTALLKSMRPSKHLTTLEDLSNELSYLSLHSDGKSQGAVGWPEFEYSFEIYQPSQRAEVQSSLPKRDWSEIGGYKSLKQKMKQATLLPLLQPEVFTRLGVQPTSGLLLYGPSGCGKTAMVHALVAESMMNVISIKGPEIFSKYFGETESKIRQLFATAKQIAPCVMFIDEMDAIGSKRAWDSSDSGGGVNERVLSTLLNEMDGVEGRQGVIVIGCTNRPHDIDDAVLRPGRLDQLVYIGLPTKEDRMEIIQILTKKMAVSPEIDIESLAQQTEYCTGADLDNMFREAGILALRQNINASVIEEKHLQRVIESTCERARHQVLNENSLLVFEKFQNDHDF